MRKTLYILTIIGIIIIGCGNNQTADELFTGAENARNEKDIKRALSNLDLLIKKYPDHVLAAKTQYLIGDIYMNDLRDFDSAIAAYVDVVNNFSGTNQEAQAQFMIGYIYANILNDNSQAELNYKNFLDRFPDHELAPSVQFELDHLGKDINEIDVLKHITS
ncbi:MAG: tetratricopeptide repeat protein [Candidatus Marinimicrobia bacterium]|nr:tetratricopeptide repeat protein [Candidatus Neomarinimicrobiota bacterium]